MTAVRVALDAMGGDEAPAATVAGALRAAKDDGVDVVLVGERGRVEAELERAGGAGALEIVDAADVVGMDEDPVAALRAKPQASVRIACQLVADGAAGAVVSAGSTGATLAAALLTLRRVPGVRRPVVAAVLPTGQGGRAVLVDAGGSMDVHADVFPGYAAMGAAYARVIGVSQPRIGLLNVGAEDGKGNALAKDAFAALRGVPGFAGNVEPPDVFGGEVDVVVTDGFTGNVFLKTVEAIAAHAAGGGSRPEAAATARDGADTAAMLLGVGGEVLVAHGAAGVDDVAQALRTAARVAEAGLSRRIAEAMAGQGGDRRE